ncbi:hypothetical protein PV396_15215 [Streptomyces sp. ME02-8801-2C]|uniref:hypothetical protein n=1 Tax=Streptomyces sp. ME02-8801-2C TaxID=3028680 RepID=UPI0029A88564|nr:hypothetical protein [Streptomyces sp. ME02-8801-2C]MDX3453288.1 hypothetical protein [Streptomyces sp. ME02-8801-2C]
MTTCTARRCPARVRGTRTHARSRSRARDRKGTPDPRTSGLLIGRRPSQLAFAATRSPLRPARP